MSSSLRAFLETVKANQKAQKLVSSPYKRPPQKRTKPPQKRKTKWCPRCEEMLPVAEFYTNRTRPDGFEGICKYHRGEENKRHKGTEAYKAWKHNYFLRNRTLKIHQIWACRDAIRKAKKRSMNSRSLKVWQGTQATIAKWEARLEQLLQQTQ